MIVQGIPTQYSLRFWVSKDEGNLNATIVNKNDRTQEPPIITKTDLKLNNGELIASLFSISATLPGTEYLFTLKNSNGKVVEVITCRSLPSSISETGLQISLGSCYWVFSKIVKELASHYPEKAKPVFRFLVGDQMYNDCFGPSSATPAFEFPITFANYESQWKNEAFKKFLMATPTGVLADDHELWNDYPHSQWYQLWHKLASAMQIGNLKNDSKSAFKVYQSSLNPNGSETFDFNFEKELSFFVLDTRLTRTEYDSVKPKFILSDETGKLKHDDRTRVLDWLAGLTAPGVLVLSNTMADFINQLSGSDGYGLPDYGNDYYDLWKALVYAPHDVLILTGDIHYNRLGYIDTEIIRNNGLNRTGRVYECVCSPLCVLDMMGSKGSFNKKNNYDEKKFSFDISGSLMKRIRKTYTNLLPFKKFFDEDTSSYAILDFNIVTGGVEFSVTYHNSSTGEILMSTNQQDPNNQKLILY